MLIRWILKFLCLGFALVSLGLGFENSRGLGRRSLLGVFAGLLRLLSGFFGSRQLRIRGWIEGICRTCLRRRAMIGDLMIGFGSS